jgi:hypothetical protein
MFQEHCNCTRKLTVHIKIVLVIMQEGLRDKCSLAEHEIKQITAALDANHDGEV